MGFWANCINRFIKWYIFPFVRKTKTKSIESVLKKAIGLLEPERLEEIKTFIRSQQTKQGGFADRSGQCDLYYSLFGFFLTDLFSLGNVRESCKHYVRQKVFESNLQGVDLYCGVILYAKLWAWNPVSEKLRTQVITELKTNTGKQSGYNLFLGILALYYLGDFIEIKKQLKQLKSLHFQSLMPCPVMAATLILFKIAGHPILQAEDKLYLFYRGNGGFAALSEAPAEDLLSTAVALYALQFMDADLKRIKPDCLSFINDLYQEGGFCSMLFDMETDVEYTFYGLLALGSLYTA
jgi:hypothetical protein